MSLMSIGRAEDPIIKAVCKATGLDPNLVKSITLSMGANEVTRLQVESLVAQEASDEIAYAISTFELHRRDD